MELNRRFVTKHVLVLVFLMGVLASQLTPTFRILYSFKLPPLLCSESVSKCLYEEDLLKVSVWGGVKSLWNRKAYVLSVMVACWSGIWPLLKVVGYISDTFVSASKAEKVHDIVLLLGKLSFLDVYAVLLLVLTVRIPKVSGCMSFLGLDICKELGYIRTEVLSGLLFFAVAIAVTNTLFRITDLCFKQMIAQDTQPVPVKLPVVAFDTEGLTLSSKKYDRFKVGQRGKNKFKYLVSVTLNIVLILASLLLIVGSTFYIPLLKIQVTTKIDVAKLAPKESIYSLSDVYLSLLLGKTGGETFDGVESIPLMPVSGSLKLFVTITAVTVTFIPLCCCVLQLASYIFDLKDSFQGTENVYEQSRNGKFVKQMLLLLSDWSHLDVFLFALFLISLQMEKLSEDFRLPKDLEKKLMIPDISLGRIAITLLDGFNLLLAAVCFIIFTQISNNLCRFPVLQNEEMVDKNADELTYLPEAAELDSDEDEERQLFVNTVSVT